MPFVLPDSAPGRERSLPPRGRDPRSRAPLPPCAGAAAWLLLALLVVPALGPRAAAAAAGITLGPRVRLFTDGEYDMKDVPDMHLAMIEEPDSSYRVWISGIIDTSNGSTGLMTTRDFLSYAPLAGDSAHAQPVLAPRCNAPWPAACATDFDAGYAGANAVFRARNGQDLVMFYHGETRTFGDTTNAHAPFYAEVGLARSSDEGLTWTRQGAIVSGADPIPASEPRSMVNGVPAPGGLRSGGYYYLYCAYFPTAGAADDLGHPVIQVARAPADSDGAPGTWTKYYAGAFGSQPGLGGRGDSIVPMVSACPDPRQPWVAYSTYLHAWVMLFACSSGWFFSTSTDLVAWTPPIQFYVPPAGDTLFTPNEATDDNLIFVTPGNAPQVIGQTGYALFARTPSFGYGTGSNQPHELFYRTFTFTGSLAGVGTAAANDAHLRVSPNPFHRLTRVSFALERPGPVEAAVYDVAGRKVRELYRGTLAAGSHELTWDGAGAGGAPVGGGIYFLRVTGDGRTLTSRVSEIR